jgi:hypothetical protein
MGWISRLLGSKEKTDNELLKSLLDLQREQISADSEIRKLERQITLQTKALELENLERISEERRKDAAEKERLRQQRREWAANARAKLNQKKASTSSMAHAAGAIPGCVVCADPTNPKLTADEILWHQGGHPGAMNQ